LKSNNILRNDTLPPLNGIRLGCIHERSLIHDMLFSFLNTFVLIKIGTDMIQLLKNEFHLTKLNELKFKSKKQRRMC